MMILEGRGVDPDSKRGKQPIRIGSIAVTSRAGEVRQAGGYGGMARSHFPGFNIGIAFDLIYHCKPCGGELQF